MRSRRRLDADTHASRPLSPSSTGARTRPSTARVATLAAVLVVTLASWAVPAGGAPNSAAPGSPAPAVAVASSPPAGSVTTIVSDPDDTTGPLDVRTVRLYVDAASGRAHQLRYTVHTTGAFRSAELHPRWRRFVVELDTDGRAGAERNVAISARDGRLVAELISNSTRQVLAELDVRRSGRRGITVSGSPQELGARRIFWTVDWHRRGDVVCGSVGGRRISCQDSVPDDGWLRLDRPAWP